MPVAMSRPWIDSTDVRAVVKTLRSGELALGRQAAEFERTMAAYTGTRHGVAVSSGTAGLHLAAIAAGVGAGDNVVTSTFSFIASTNCFVYEGARPRFVDIDAATLMPDPRAIADAVTARTRAILTVDIFGNPADADAIAPVARQHGLAVIEDACEALGSKYKGRPAGSLGDIGIFGFYPNKQITAGEGGMIVTNRRDWDALCRSLRNQGRDEHNAWFSHARVGYNYRLDEMSAALGLSQLARVDRLLRGRRRVAAAYGARLAALRGDVEVPRALPTTTEMGWFSYVVLLAPELRRDRVMRALAERGVPTRAYFSPLHLQPVYRQAYGFRPGQFPVAEAISQRCMALPFHGRLTAREVAEVCRALRQVLAGRGVRQTRSSVPGRKARRR